MTTKRFLKTFVFTFLGIHNAYAEAQTVAPNMQPPAIADNSIDRLHVANPFYLPYARDFQITFQTAWLRDRVRTDIQPHTFSGVPQSAIYSDTQGNAFSTSLALRYGVLDRLSFGLSTDYYILGPPSTTATGRSTTFAGIQNAEGFTGAEFSVNGRLAGLRPGQVYVDVMFALRPGIGRSTTNVTGPGRVSTTGAVAVGYNFRYFTFGLAGSTYIAPSASTSTTGTALSYGNSTTITTTVSVPPATLLSAQALLHAELKYFYVRGSIGHAKDTEAADTPGSTTKYAYWVYGAAAGFKFGASSMLDFSWSATPEIRGDEYNVGLPNLYNQYVTSGPKTRYAITFSVKF